jgi:hypothetical protein
MFEKIKNLFKSSKQKEAEKYKVDAAPLDPKEAANAKKEPWVAVLETHVNPDSPRNGFFELDWNEYFVLMLRNNGYTGVTEEEIVDQWFSDLCREVGSEENVPGMDRRGSGFINVNNLGNGKSEVS